MADAEQKKQPDTTRVPGYFISYQLKEIFSLSYSRICMLYP